MPSHRPRLREFFEELKRRHVFRVATVYLVAAWVIIQVATTILPILGLPNWILVAIVIAALVGFPVTLVVAWAFDLTREGITVTDEPERHVRLPWLRGSIASLIVLIIVAGGYAFYLRVRPAEAARTPSVAVFPFAVQGGPSVEYLREGIVNLLSTSFNGVGRMRSVDPTTVLNSLSDAQRSGVDRSTAERVAGEIGATSFVIGEIAERAADQITLTATLYDLENDGTAPNTVTVTGREDEIPDKVDELAGLLLTSHMRDHASRLSRTAALTTHKLSALKAYLMGEAEYREARWPTAMSFFRRAVDEDSTFALANYRLAVAADWASQFDTARVAIERAVRHLNRLSTRDRELVLAFNSAIRGRADEAEEAYQRITTDYPDDVEAWYRYGEVLFHYNNVRGRSVFESRPMFERALRAAPDAEPMALHLMELALYNGDYQTFDQYMQRVDSTKPAAFRRLAVRRYATADARARADIERSLSNARDGDLYVVASGLAQFRHELLAADRLSELLAAPQRPPHVRGTAQLLRAQYALARGQWQLAQQHLDELTVSYPGIALTHRALYASVPIFGVPPAELRSLRQQLTDWDAHAAQPVDAPNVYLAAHNGVQPVLRLYLIGILSARLMDGAAAGASAAALDTISDPAAIKLARHYATVVRAHAAYERGDAQRAVDLLADTRTTADLDHINNSVFWNGAVDRFLRAEALSKLGRNADAHSWYASVPEGRNEVFLAAPVHLRLAEAAAAAGNDDRADSHYARFLALWSSPDPALKPIVDRARQAAHRPVASK